MVQEEKTYNEELQEIKKFLAKRRKIKALALEVGVDARTVHYAFKAENPDDLTGKKIDVISRAIKMKREIEKTLDLKESKENS